MALRSPSDGCKREYTTHIATKMEFRSAFEFSTCHINRFAIVRIKCACSWTVLCECWVNCWHLNSVDPQLLWPVVRLHDLRILPIDGPSKISIFSWIVGLWYSEQIFVAPFSAECGRFACEMECKYLFMIHSECIQNANAFNDLTWYHLFASSPMGSSFFRDAKVQVGFGDGIPINFLLF